MYHYHKAVLAAAAAAPASSSSSSAPAAAQPPPPWHEEDDDATEGDSTEGSSLDNSMLSSLNHTRGRLMLSGILETGALAWRVGWETESLPLSECERRCALSACSIFTLQIVALTESRGPPGLFHIARFM